jgi:hypothetical protein
MDYSYFELTLPPDPAAQRHLADHVYGRLGDKVVAVFGPSLGFGSNQALVLTDRSVDPDAVLRAPDVLSGTRHQLSPTLRPKDGDRPAPLGVYVHNWFTTDGPVEEFVRLSGVAWPDFEASFETRIFGLFLADATDADRRDGVRRLLLMTGYRDLGEWWRSRSPAPTAREAFLRRREMTRVSLARATILLPRGAAG